MEGRWAFCFWELEERHGVFQKHEACHPFSWGQALVLELKERKSRLRGGGWFHLGLSKGPLFFLCT